MHDPLDEALHKLVDASKLNYVLDLIARINHTLGELMSPLRPEVAAKIEEVRQAVSDAVDTEIAQVKTLVSNGASTQDVLDALDSLKTNLVGKVDTIDTSAAAGDTNPPSGETGTGG